MSDLASTMREHMPWMLAWIELLGYTPERVHEIDVHHVVVRDHEAEQTSGGYRVMKPTWRFIVTLTFDDKSKQTTLFDRRDPKRKERQMEQSHPEQENTTRGITARDFVEAFTYYDDSHGPMPPEELLKRLDITLTQLKEDLAQGRAKPPNVANCLRGALTRLAQAYGGTCSPQERAAVSAKVDELVMLSLDVIGI